MMWLADVWYFLGVLKTLGVRVLRFEVVLNHKKAFPNREPMPLTSNFITESYQ